MNVDFRDNYQVIFQERYIEKMTTAFGLTESKVVTTPMEFGLKICKSEVPNEDSEFEVTWARS